MKSSQRVVKAAKGGKKETAPQRMKREHAESMAADGAAVRREERITSAPPLSPCPDAPQAGGCRIVAGGLSAGSRTGGDLT